MTLQDAEKELDKLKRLSAMAENAYYRVEELRTEAQGLQSPDYGKVGRSGRHDGFEVRVIRCMEDAQKWESKYIELEFELLESIMNLEQKAEASDVEVECYVMDSLAHIWR